MRLEDRIFVTTSRHVVVDNLSPQRVSGPDYAVHFRRAYYTRSGSDLALLEVEDPSMFGDRRPASVSTTPLQLGTDYVGLSVREAGSVFLYGKVLEGPVGRH